MPDKLNETLHVFVVYAVLTLLASVVFTSSVVVLGGWLSFTGVYDIALPLFVGAAIYAALLTRIHMNGDYDNSWVPRLLSIAWYSAILNCVLYMMLLFALTGVALFMQFVTESIFRYAFATTSILSVAGAVWEVWSQHRTHQAKEAAIKDLLNT